MCNCTSMANISGNEANARLGLTGFANYAGKTAMAHTSGKDFTSGFGNYAGPAVIQPVQPVGITVTAPKIALPTLNVPVNTTVATPTPATAPKKSVWDVVASALDVFSKPKPATAQASPEDLPEPKGIPKAVWIVLGVLVVLAVVFFTVRANRK